MDGAAAGLMAGTVAGVVGCSIGVAWMLTEIRRRAQTNRLAEEAPWVASAAISEAFAVRNAASPAAVSAREASRRAKLRAWRASSAGCIAVGIAVVGIATQYANDPWIAAGVVVVGLGLWCGWKALPSVDAPAQDWIRWSAALGLAYQPVDSARPLQAATLVPMAAEPDAKMVATNVLRGRVGKACFEAWNLASTHATRFTATFFHHRVTVLEMPSSSSGIHIMARRGARFRGRGRPSGFESHAFERIFEVTASDPRFASAVVHPRLMELIAAVGPSYGWDWTGWNLVVTCPGRLTMANALDALPAAVAFRALVPSFVGSAARVEESRFPAPQAPVVGLALRRLRRLQWGSWALLAAGLACVALVAQGIAARPLEGTRSSLALLGVLAIPPTVVSLIVVRSRLANQRRILQTDLGRLKAP